MIAETNWAIPTPRELETDKAIEENASREFPQLWLAQIDKTPQCERSYLALEVYLAGCGPTPERIGVLVEPDIHAPRGVSYLTTRDAMIGIWSTVPKKVFGA